MCSFCKFNEHVRRSPQYIEKNRECDRARVGASETEQGNNEEKGERGGAHMHGKDFRPLFSHGVRQLVCHRTNFKLFTHTRTHTHTAAEFSFACVCVFVIWIKLWNSHTHTHTPHTHTEEHGKYYSRQQKAWASEGRDGVGGGGGRCNVSSIVTNVVAQRPLPTTPAPSSSSYLPPQPALSAALAAVPLRFAFLLLEVCVKALLYLLLLLL